jgi:hypothetical protein
MWSGFDPELRREFESIRQLVALRHQTPTREWPLIFDDEQCELLVVREWPDGSVTAYMLSDGRRWRRFPSFPTPGRS